MSKIKMNDGYVLIKQQREKEVTGSFVMLDSSGNCVRGLVIESFDNARFQPGNYVYCSGGTNVVVKAEEFLVVPVDKIFFTTEE